MASRVTVARKKPAPRVTVAVADKLLLSVDEFAAMVGVGHKLAWAEVMGQRVRSVKIGRRRLIPRAAIDDYVARLAAA